MGDKVGKEGQGQIMEKFVHQPEESWHLTTTYSIVVKSMHSMVACFEPCLEQNVTLGNLGNLLSLQVPCLYNVENSNT